MSPRLAAIAAATLLFLLSNVAIEAQGGGKKKPEFDWNRTALKLKKGTFGFHLLDVDKKPASSKDLYGKPQVILVASLNDDVCGNAMAKLEKLVKEFPGVELVGIYNTMALPEDKQFEKLREHLDKYKTHQHRALIAYTQVFDQVDGLITPWLLVINKDGSVERNVFGWTDGKAGGPEGQPSNESMLRQLLPKVLGKAKPTKSAPDPLPLDDNKGPEPFKDLPREPSVGSGE